MFWKRLSIAIDVIMSGLRLTERHIAAHQNRVEYRDFALVQRGPIPLIAGLFTKPVSVRNMSKDGEEWESYLHTWLLSISIGQGGTFQELAFEYMTSVSDLIETLPSSVNVPKSP